ncbi:uncharacterized mitochondrial protein AtMg00810-like [Prosopis cineraria]|uniref:uncharacterized mitochondrial protein AtMg00810-like n=1 Tax=Prosopis cineraria TaxID=364024 RepID=UPI0024102332|nr:uncharacterized mitochondrial protein AtMg00810-like [Prosopis cineraria]
MIFYMVIFMWKFIWFYLKVLLLIQELFASFRNHFYGLKQASRQWFVRCKDASFTLLLVYVDDVILAGNDTAEIHRIKVFLDAKFKIKDLGPLKYFLGLEIARSNAGLSVCQRKFALDILSDCRVLAARLVSTPMDRSTKLSQDSGSSLEDPSVYRRLVGRLLYLTTTRPDLSYAVSQLSQFISAPRTTHLQAAYRVLGYLKSCPGRGLFFHAHSDFKLKAFCDSDWAGYPDARRSITGFCVYLDQALIAWRSKKQHIVSRSSSEAEYRALAAVTCEVQWLFYLLIDL